MRSLEQINKDNDSDGKPLLDTHPGRTTGLPDTNDKAWDAESRAFEQERIQYDDCHLYPDDHTQENHLLPPKEN